MSLNNLKRVAISRKGWHINYNILGRKNCSDSTSNFIVARHWNSDTPIIPRKANTQTVGMDPNGAIGGGYFIRHQGIGIVVDPGHAFLKGIYERHDISVQDIDIIIITHFHQDHCADIANYLTLSRIAGYTPYVFAPKPVKLYLELLNSAIAIQVFPGDRLNILKDEIKIFDIEFMPTLHWQTITPISLSLSLSYFHNFIDFHMSAVGVKINLNTQDDTKLKFRDIWITGDTMFPIFEGSDFSSASYDMYLAPSKKHIHLNYANPSTRTYLEAILRLYFANFIQAYLGKSADLVCYHIGSIESQFADITDGSRLDFQYKGHHLGVLGVLRLMNTMDISSQKLAVITEWGEELRGHRKNIALFIEKYISMNSNSKNNKLNLRVFPSDLDLMIDLRNGLIKCSDHSSYHDYKHMRAQEDSCEYIKYRSGILNSNLNYFEKTCDWK